MPRFSEERSNGRAAGAASEAEAATAGREVASLGERPRIRSGLRSAAVELLSRGAGASCLSREEEGESTEMWWLGP